MTSQEKSIIAPLLYYNLLGQPLTPLEMFKYQPPLENSSLLSFAELRDLLKSSVFLKKKLKEKNGLYFLNGYESVLSDRSAKLKITQLKWKKIRKIAKWLTIVPFVKLVAATGSLTAQNSQEQSDLDVLIITAKNRLWLTRLYSVFLLGLLGKRRHGRLTCNRLCLNCFIAQDGLKIKKETRHHDLHSAQEYRRLTPLLETEKNTYKSFIEKNTWLAAFFNRYPWSNNETVKKIKPRPPFNQLRFFQEKLLSGSMGDWLENKCRLWQEKRINKKRKAETAPADQVYVNKSCLMFHPQSKAFHLLNEYNLKMKEFTNYATG